MTTPRQTTEAERAAKWLMTWFLQRYEDPVDVCPYESAEGGFQYIWGGPHNAGDVLIDAWSDIFTEAFLEQVAARLEEEQDCYEWSERAGPEEGDTPCSICGRLADLQCATCERSLCWAHAFVRRQEWDTHTADGVDILCAEHAVPTPGYAIDPPRNTD
jgi:hypothetical protein